MIQVEQTPCWKVTCDRCGEGDNTEHGGHFHYATEAEALTSVRNYDWMLVDGHHLCPTCWEDGIPEEVACPDCGVGTGACCTGERPFTPTHEARVRAWITAQERPGATGR